MILDKVIPEEGDLNSKHLVEPTMQPLVENNSVEQQMAQDHVQQQNGDYLPLFVTEMGTPQKEFDKAQDAKPRKVIKTILLHSVK